MQRIKKALWMVVEKILTWCVNPFFRARVLRWLGASIGKNVRIYEARFFNLEQGFKNLKLGDDVHVGPFCRLDLMNKIELGDKCTISPAVTVLTHSDPGSSHGSELVEYFPLKSLPVTIGSSSWVGVGSTILCGVTIGDRVAIGANSLVNQSIPSDSVAAGIPCKKIRELTANST
jgi:acetyltransferase-like isoleucine patch superfamily enzyme